MTADATPPSVSVIMANFNGEKHISTAVSSVLRQSLGALELIVSDDASTDSSVARAHAAADGDPRLVTIAAPGSDGPGGPGAARNRALAAARGRWIAIVDSDDVIHPERIERLVAAAERDGADIVADDMLEFDDAGERPPRGFLAGALAARPSWVAPADYIRSNVLYGRGASLGYLKPVIRRAVLDAHAPSYDEDLPIGEDFDLIARMLLAGARMRVYPCPLYFYRKHAHSISHRLSTPVLDTMLRAHDRLEERATGDGPLRAALRRRRGSIETARAFAELVDALKTRAPARALAAALRRPAALWLLRLPILTRLRPARRAAPRPAAPEAPRATLVASDANRRDAIRRAVQQAGFAVDDADAGIPKDASGFPADRAAMIALARRVRPGASAVVLDDPRLVPLAPYALSPDAPTIAVARDGGHASAAATIVGPCALEVVAEPQVGRSDLVLFAGGPTTADVIGLRWFLQACWPRVRAARPDAALAVAGAVARGLEGLEEAFQRLDTPDALRDAYRDAGVVIAPARTGGGLPERLVDALAAGKAVVAASAAVRGWEAVVAPALIVEDDPERFAAAVAGCLADEDRRRALAGAAAACARERFALSACLVPSLPPAADGNGESGACRTGTAAGDA